MIREMLDKIRLLTTLPRRRNPKLHGRNVRVALKDVPEGAERKDTKAHTVRDIVFHAEGVTRQREVCGDFRTAAAMRHRLHRVWRRDAASMGPTCQRCCASRHC